MKMIITIPILIIVSTFFYLDMATLIQPSIANCGNKVVLTCTATNCSIGYVFTRDKSVIYSHRKPPSGTDPGKYSANVTSDKQVQLTINNIQLSDAGMYACACGFSSLIDVHNLQYECKASKTISDVTTNKKLTIASDMLYPEPSNIGTARINATTQLQGTYKCVSSLSLALHYRCTWTSTESVLDGNYSYSITVTTGTQTGVLSGIFKIVTPTSPNISNLVIDSSNRQVLPGVQGSPLTIQCVSSGGIPAPTLAWYRNSTGTSPLAQSIASDSVKMSDGTYTVTLNHTFTPLRTDDMATFFCRVFYPGATAGSSPDPSPASALVYIDLKPDAPTVSPLVEAVAGGNITLECTSTNGRPPPSITWLYQDKIIAGTNTTIVHPTSETYTVVSVLRTTIRAVHNGQTATCMVSHTTLLKPITGIVTLDVKFGPFNGTTNISGNQATPATKSNLIHLNCTSGSSNPASNITWYNGSYAIPNQGEYTRWTGVYNGFITSNILTITPTRYMDGDRVECRTDNGHGSDTTYVVLNIFYSPKIHSLLNTTAIQGQPNVSLTCSASSKPPATFTWYRGTTVQASGRGTFTDNSFSYVISRVDRTNAGAYQCQAENNVAGMDYSDAYLTVKYPPTVTVSATASPPYTVTCTADGYPDSYTYRNWIQIWPGYGTVATIPFNGTTLTLTNATYQSSGVYVCGASNGVAVYGTDVQYIKGNKTVSIKGPPVLTYPSPNGLRVRVAGRVGHDAITEIKYWSNVGGCIVRCYKLVEGSRSFANSCVANEENTEVILPVYNHMVIEKGTLAKVTIHIGSEKDFTDYDVALTQCGERESVLGITIFPQVVGSTASSHIGLIIGVVTGVFVLVVIFGVVFVFWRRKGKDNHSKETRNFAFDRGSSDIVECALYESSGPLESDERDREAANANLYAVVLKKKGHDETKGDAQDFKDRVSHSPKEKKQKQKNMHKDVYENSPDSSIAWNDHEHPKPVSMATSFVPKIKNKDGLIYADLEFNENPVEDVIHGLDNATTYVQVDFTKAANPLPDSDEEI